MPNLISTNQASSPMIRPNNSTYISMIVYSFEILHSIKKKNLNMF